MVQAGCGMAFQVDDRYAHGAESGMTFQVDVWRIGINANVHGTLSSVDICVSAAYRPAG